MISSTKGTTNPLYAEKEIVGSLQTGTVNCTAGWSNCGNGFSVTIAKAGVYILKAGFTANTVGAGDIDIAIAVGGVIEGSTYRKFFSNDAANSIRDIAYLESEPVTLSVGDVVTLQNDENSGTGVIYYSAGASVGYLQAEMVDQVIPISIDPDYSTTEVETGRKWIDGKPIYRLVVDCGALPNATTKNVAHGITTIETLIDCYGVAEDTSVSDMRPLPNTNVSGGGSVIQLNADNTNVKFHTGTTDRSMFDKTYVILEYTKV